MNDDSVILIGWKERIQFPDWGIRRVSVKIDTGARTSALGCDSYVILDDSNGGAQAELRLSLDRKHPERQLIVQTPILGYALVTTSNGMTEQRPVIETRIRLGPIAKAARFTLTNRAHMRFPVILGRLALADAFVVDVSQVFTQTFRR